MLNRVLSSVHSSVQWDADHEEVDLDSDSVDIEEFTIERFQRTWEDCTDLLVKTPVIRWPTQLPVTDTHPRFPGTLFLKLETFQIGSTYHARSCAAQLRHKVLCEKDTLPEKPVAVCASVGNFGTAFAIMCHRLGIDYTMVMSLNSNSESIKFHKSNNGTVRFAPSSQLEEHLDILGSDINHFTFNMMNNEMNILGLGMLMLEILEDVPDPDVVVVSCEGGPLVAACATVLWKLGKHNVKVYGVEPEGAPAMCFSRSEDQLTMLSSAKCCDPQLAYMMPCEISFQLCRQAQAKHVLVSESSIEAARTCLFRHGIAADFAGSIAMAAILENKVPVSNGQKVVAVVASGNYYGTKFTYK